MSKRVEINQLAVKAVKDSVAFTELYNTIEDQFKGIVENYLFRNNLAGFNFDTADYLSAVGQAMWECLEGYDIEKGDFMPRLVMFARKRMKEITDYNLASKRFDKTKQAISFEQLFESEEFQIEATNDCFNDTYKIILDFIKADKEGTVIEILLSTSDSKLRNAAFRKLFGKYTATERKKVQRTRERLVAHLTQYCVFI